MQYLAAPDVECEGDLLVTVELTVSMVFAARYVPPYSVRIKAKGRARKNLCGREMAVHRDLFVDSIIVARPVVFSIMALEDEGQSGSH